jgi:hypothetical protein
MVTCHHSTDYPAAAIAAPVALARLGVVAIGGRSSVALHEISNTHAAASDYPLRSESGDSWTGTAISLQNRYITSKAAVSCDFFYS